MYNDVSVPRGPGCLVQLLWLVFVGWWATPIWVSVAWILCLTIVGMPFGVMMLNRVPQVLALRDPSDVRLQASWIDKETWVYQYVPARQPPFLVRALYFLLVGWWLSAIWMILAHAVSCTIIGLPLGIWMFDRVPALVSLRS
jgi:uncharacterized membrane protein YccF (DUF307 family)